MEPGDKATKFIQSLKYRQEDDKFNRMFDLRAICKEEKTYHVTFSAIVNNKKQRFEYDVFTKLKLIY